MKKRNQIAASLLALCMAVSPLTVSAGAIPTINDENLIVDPGPSNPDYRSDFYVNLPVASTWEDSAWVYEFSGSDQDVYIYIFGASSASYNLGYSIGGSKNLAGWFPNLRTGQDGIVIHANRSSVYQIRASVPEGTGGEFYFIASYKPLDASLLEDLPFTDIPKAEDCTTRQDTNLRQAVLEAYANGWMTGTTETTFSPDASFNRAMLWTILARINGVDTTGGNPWYEPARQWVMNTGISDGTHPERSATLQEVITMLYNQAGQPTVTLQADTTINGQVADWARDAMDWGQFIIAYAQLGDMLLEATPDGTVTRGDLAVILAGYMNLMNYISHTAQ